MTSPPEPTRKPPVPRISPLDADLDAIGKIARSAQRLAVVRYLRANPDGYLGAIQKGTGIPGPSLAPHLRELEAQGIIRGDLPATQRRGRTVRYQLDTDRLAELIEHLRAQLLA